MALFGNKGFILKYEHGKHIKRREYTLKADGKRYKMNLSALKGGVSLK